MFRHVVLANLERGDAWDALTIPLARTSRRFATSVVGEIVAGAQGGGAHATDIAMYESETAALRGELNGAGAAGHSAGGGRPDAPRVIVLMCHEERDEVFVRKPNFRSLKRAKPARRDEE